MTIGSPKSSIIFCIGSLATFTIFVSCVLISFPIYSSLQVYFQEGHQFKRSTQDIAASNTKLPRLDAIVEKNAIERSIKKDLGSKQVYVNSTKVWPDNKNLPPGLSNKTIKLEIEVHNGKGDSSKFHSDGEKRLDMVDNSVSRNKPEIIESVMNDWMKSSMVVHNDKEAIPSGKSESRRSAEEPRKPKNAEMILLLFIFHPDWILSLVAWGFPFTCSALLAQASEEKGAESEVRKKVTPTVDSSK